MPDNWIQLIPSDPDYVPPREAHLPAATLLKEFAPEADEVNVEVTDHVHFVDPGDNWEGVRCPKCGADIEDPWWMDVMDDAHEDGFVDLWVEMPCCGGEASLNDLYYVWPAGFAQFVLGAMNPNVPELTFAQLSQLEQLLGCRLRQVFQHI